MHTVQCFEAKENKNQIISKAKAYLLRVCGCLRKFFVSVTAAEREQKSNKNTPQRLVFFPARSAWLFPAGKVRAKFSPPTPSRNGYSYDADAAAVLFATVSPPLLHVCVFLVALMGKDAAGGLERTDSFPFWHSRNVRSTVFLVSSLCICCHFSWNVQYGGV